VHAGELSAVATVHGHPCLCCGSRMMNCRVVWARLPTPTSAAHANDQDGRFMSGAFEPLHHALSRSRRCYTDGYAIARLVPLRAWPCWVHCLEAFRRRPHRMPRCL